MLFAWPVGQFLRLECLPACCLPGRLADMSETRMFFGYFAYDYVKGLGLL